MEKGRPLPSPQRGPRRGEVEAFGPGPTKRGLFQGSFRCRLGPECRGQYIARSGVLELQPCVLVSTVCVYVCVRAGELAPCFPGARSAEDNAERAGFREVR